MFTFAFPEELFKFQYDNPASEPLFQFPPTRASVHPISHQIYKSILGAAAPRPPYRGFLRSRPPMTTSADPEERYKYQHDNPAAEPLYQYPPTRATL